MTGRKTLFFWYQTPFNTCGSIIPIFFFFGNRLFLNVFSDDGTILVCAENNNH